jgi:REP element-mobilizing transposase RayT
MEIYAWCIITNHVHLAFRSIEDIPPEKILGDLKRLQMQPQM